MRAQPDSHFNYYKKMLAIFGSLTKLFSDGQVPYLNYRITENLFCKAFNAKNLSRSDVSADASIDKKGIGIKTFVDSNGKSYQKIAEFNKDLSLFRDLDAKEKVFKIAELRNERIDTTKRIYGLNEMVYHCISRKENLISVFECPMDNIDIQKISKIEARRNSITFEDGKNKYNFNISKSTLYKRFISENIIFKLPVNILDDPFDLVEKKFLDIKGAYYSQEKEKPYVILPLYSIKDNQKLVHPKSGLNQWNAGGRKRDYGEVYIQIPAWIHKRFPGFFLPRDKSFNLVLPDGNILNAKVCQENSKALMTNPNNALADWLLRQVLNLKEGEILTYEKLEKIGLDSVIIERIDNQTYFINFKKSGTFEEFIDQNK